MGVKQGFKKTEVGNLPDDWRVLSLDNCCNFENGDRSSNYPSPTSFRSSGVPFINAGHLESGRIKQEALDFISQSAYEKLSGGKVNAGDILFCLRGSLGKFGVVGNDFGPGAIASSLVIIRPKTSSFNLGYLSHYFSSWLCERMIELWAGGAAQPNLGASDLQRFLVPLPPTLTEQEAIAGALSDADAWIESLEQLIAKKRQIKQGAMQELLTGKRRLPGFSGKWETKRLGDLGSFLKGSGVRKNEANSGDIPCVRYGEIYTHHNDFIRRFNSSISRAVAETATRLNYGDLLFAGSGETKAEIGKCVAFAHDMEAYAGGDIVILRSIKSVPVFMGYYCNTRAVAEQKAARGQGDAVVHISASALGGVQICVPEIHEQTAIATVLSDMDTEIESLESKLAKAREVKHGMMQELLTGRIRLTPSSEEQ